MKSSMKFLALLMCLPLSAAAQSLVCDETLITKGTTREEVAARCGEPAHIERQVVYSERAVGLPAGPAPGKGPGLLPGMVSRSGTETPVELWTYNFGPSRLMAGIRFENGVVIRIESLGYGY